MGGRGGRRQCVGAGERGLAMSRVHAIRVHKTGGPEELRYEEVELGHPGAGEALVRHTAIGLNFS